MKKIGYYLLTNLDYFIGGGIVVWGVFTDNWRCSVIGLCLMIGHLWKRQSDQE